MNEGELKNDSILLQVLALIGEICGRKIFLHKKSSPGIGGGRDVLDDDRSGRWYFDYAIVYQAVKIGCYLRLGFETICL